MDKTRRRLLGNCLAAAAIASFVAGCGGGGGGDPAPANVDLVPAPGGGAVAAAPSGASYSAVDDKVYRIAAGTTSLLNFTAKSASTANGGVNAVATDAAGNAYIASSASTISLGMTMPTDGRITRITPAGNVTVLPVVFGTAIPVALTVAPDGSVLAELYNEFSLPVVRIVRVQADGALVDIASSGVPRFQAFVADGSGNIFGTSGNAVYKLAADGAIAVLAGDPAEAGNANGQVALARFNSPVGITRDGQGNLFVADSANHAVRKIAADGTVTTFAAQLANPWGLAIDSAGLLYVSEPGAPGDIHTITTAGAVSTLMSAPY